MNNVKFEKPYERKLIKIVKKEYNKEYNYTNMDYYLKNNFYKNYIDFLIKIKF
jgi:hypothetical protein